MGKNVQKESETHKTSTTRCQPDGGQRAPHGVDLDEHSFPGVSQTVGGGPRR